jgi:hypothetical protein
MIAPQKRRKGLIQERLDLVGLYYRRGYTYRKMMEVLFEDHGILVKNINTITRDVATLLKEWQFNRIQNTDELITVELQRINLNISEAWIAWTKSKENQILKNTKTKGSPVKHKEGEDSLEVMKPYYSEKGTKEEINYGDPRFLDIILKNQREYRLLLGLYATEKKSFDITTFDANKLTDEAQLLIAEAAIKLGL